VEGQWEAPVLSMVWLYGDRSRGEEVAGRESAIVDHSVVRTIDWSSKNKGRNVHPGRVSTWVYGPVKNEITRDNGEIDGCRSAAEGVRRQQ